MNEGKRFYVLDLLRGLAVFLMILAHSVYFFHNYTSEFVSSLEQIGNTVVFTAFLLVSGAVLYIAYLKTDKGLKDAKRRLLKRFAMFLAAYYALALFVSSSEILTTYGFERWSVIFDILSFRLTPSYTEFIAPFVIFTFLVLLFPTTFRKIARSIPTALVVGGSFYLAGYLLFNTAVPTYLEPWKALLSGAEGYYRFPIYHYFPIFILGLLWGNYLIKATEIKQKVKIAKKLAIVSLVGVMLAVLVSVFYFNSFDNFLFRWPPSIPFLLIGTSFTFTFALFFYATKQLKRFPITRDFFLSMGQNAFALFWAHIFILQLYNMTGGVKVGSVYVFFFLFVLTIILSFALAKFLPFNLRFNLTFKRGNHDEQEDMLEHDPYTRLSEEVAEEVKKEVGLLKRFFFPKVRDEAERRKVLAKRYLVGAVSMVALGSVVVTPSVLQEVEQNIKSAETAYWWNDEYAYKRSLVIENLESFSSIPKGRSLNVAFDHQSLIADKKSRPDGGDIKLVFWNGSEYSEIEYWLKGNWGKSNTSLEFTVPEDIASGVESRDISIYYGNLVANTIVRSGGDPEDWRSKYKTEVTAEEEYKTVLTVDRLWNLTNTVFDDDVINISVKTREDLNSPKVTYKILKTNKKGILNEAEDLRGENVDNLWDASILLEGLKPGEYKIQATIEEGGRKYFSQKSGFYISEPMYVAWTQDWEGYDASNSYISAMERISREHNLKMTHFFSPRIYVTDTISDQRKDYMTNWVKNRVANGEDVGLHLHMHNDLVESAGVTPKTTPNWGDKGDGYGTITTAYTEEETIKILNKAIQLLTDNGFGMPLSYRAGGWFADEETLRALESVGIKIDSSGRTAYSFYSTEGPWALSPTAQPYHPDKNNQDRSGLENLNLWEIPNNGADSYWFEANDMISRFTQNYDGNILDKKKQVTYLSHPHWFNAVEQKKVDQVFDHVDGYKYENDLGPVVYVTIKDIYNDWLKDL